MPDAEKVRDERMPAGLRHHAVSRVDQDDCEIAVAGAGNQVSRVLFVAGSIGNDELPLWRGKVTIGHIDGDALFAFCLQSVGQQGKINAFAATPLVFAFCAFDLVFERALSFDK